MNMELYPRWSFSVPLVTPLKGNGSMPPLAPIPTALVAEITHCTIPDMVLGHVVKYEGEYLRLPELEMQFYLTTTPEQFCLVCVSDSENEDWYVSGYDEIPLRTLMRLHTAELEAWPIRPYIKTVQNSQLESWLVSNGALALSNALFEQVSPTRISVAEAASII